DLADLPDSVKDGLEIIPVSTVTEVLQNALVSSPAPLPDTPETPEIAAPAGEEATAGTIAH
ncbi:MAG: S16 family serine protease, partial [Pseudomonadota bacterium]